VLHCDGQRISTTTSFFSIGGHSLLFIELYHRYQMLFDFDTRILSIAPFLQQPTIGQHAKLLEKITTNDMKATEWHTLHLIQGVASFAQERIFLDEKVRFSNKIAIYNELNVLRVVTGSLSTHRLLIALRFVLKKHAILSTSIIFNNIDGTLKQCVTNKHQTFTLATEKTFKNENELQNIIYQTTIDPNLFDLSTGRVFHCQILRQQNLVYENNDNQLITGSDVLIIGFHHAAFDRTSRQIFFDDLCTAYNSNESRLEN
jgi:hypothetical protein